MLATRAMPCLLMRRGALVKTVRFRDVTYVGDPVNAVRIFNQKEVDELILLDIGATVDGSDIDYDSIGKVVGECFMPICYGGGIRTIEQMRRLFAMGIEKLSLSSAAIADPELVRRAASEFGSQAIVVTLDHRKPLLGKQTVHVHNGKQSTRRGPVELARQMEAAGAGEILLYSIDRDGTWEGFDLATVREVAAAVGVPVIASGGAGSLDHMRAAVKEAGASAVAIGSMAVFQGKDLGVLIKFPSRKQQEKTFQ